MIFKLLKTNKKSQKTQEKSCGRSMVEMLGVLAIIGVLSIGGIQGYTIAMRKYRANEILKSFNEYAVMLYTRCRSQRIYESSYYDDDIAYNEQNFCDEVPSFSEMGLAFPSGINGISFNLLGSNESIQLYSILRTHSGDMIRFYASFESKELCETTLNIIGTNISDKSEHGSCQKDTANGLNLTGYVGLIYFLMN